MQGEQESVLKERQRESAEEAAERAAAKTAAALVCFLNYEVSLAYISGHHDFKSWFYSWMGHPLSLCKFAESTCKLPPFCLSGLAI